MKFAMQLRSFARMQHRPNRRSLHWWGDDFAVCAIYMPRHLLVLPAIKRAKACRTPAWEVCVCGGEL